MEGPFDQYDEHTFSSSVAQVTEALAAGAKRLGAVVKATDAATGVLDAQFDKKMRGKILGDRSWVEVRVTAKGGTAHCSLYAFPLNAIGQKLMFGARAPRPRARQSLSYRAANRNLHERSATRR